MLAGLTPLVRRSTSYWKFLCRSRRDWAFSAGCRAPRAAAPRKAKSIKSEPPLADEGNGLFQTAVRTAIRPKDRARNTDERRAGIGLLRPMRCAMAGSRQVGSMEFASEAFLVVRACERPRRTVDRPMDLGTTGQQSPLCWRRVDEALSGKTQDLHRSLLKCIYAKATKASRSSKF